MKYLSLLLLLLIIGCSGYKKYPNELPKNLTLTVEERDKSLFTSTGLDLDIFKYNPDNKDDCMEYVGSVTADKSNPTEVGIPNEKKAYLRLQYQKDGFLRRSKTSNMDFSFTPNPKYKYEIKYIMDNGKYGLEFNKTNKNTGKTTELELYDWPECAEF